MLDEVRNRLMQDTENQRGTKRRRTNDGATKSALDPTTLIERSMLSLWKTEINKMAHKNELDKLPSFQNNSTANFSLALQRASAVPWNMGVTSYAIFNTTLFSSKNFFFPKTEVQIFYGFQ